jgi:hypothetical protein
VLGEGCGAESSQGRSIGGGEGGESEAIDVSVMAIYIQPRARLAVKSVSFRVFWRLCWARLVSLEGSVGMDWLRMGLHKIPLLRHISLGMGRFHVCLGWEEF